jgi:glycosyltransferase involved in cell wall biosynthesis
MPKVSIALPVYNGDNFVCDAIESILGQSFQDFELIITDNASTDRSGEICMGYAARDPRIRYVRNNKNIGAAANFNLAFSLARGKYFKWAAHDDVLHRDFLAACVGVLDRDPSVVLCFSRIVKIDSNGQLAGTYEYDNELAFDSDSPHHRFREFMDMRHWCVAVFGLFRTDPLRGSPLIANYVGSDRCLVAELALVGRVCRLPEFLFFRRDHPGSSVIMIKDLQKQWEWYDPSKAGKVCFPHWRFGLEFTRSVRKTPASLQRLLCYLHIASWYWKYASLLRQDLLGVARHTLRNTHLGRFLDPWLFLDLKMAARDILAHSEIGRILLVTRRQILRRLR